MRLICHDIGLQIDMEDNLPEVLYKEAIKHYPNEYGGLLIGRYSDNDRIVMVDSYILPSKYKSSKVTFDRGTAGLREKLTKFYNATPGLIYIGEWHTHPDNPAIPSSTDLKAMRKIASHNEVYINNPLLLILSVNKKSFDFIFYVYFNDKMYSYEKI